MPSHIVRIIGAKAKLDELAQYAQEHQAIRYWKNSHRKEDDFEFNILVTSDKVQGLTDKIQALLSGQEGWHIITLPVDSVMPSPQVDGSAPVEDEQAKKLVSGTITREALYDRVEAGAKANIDFLILTFLSTIVAVIGIITDSVAVVIAAMVIAPLLGPNLALSFGVTLGDRNLILRAVKTNCIGLGFTFVLAVLFGLFVPNSTYVDNIEYITRIDIGLSAVVLALASGAAAVLSLTSGISSAMVGVMVAVAMMPPAVVFGMSLGAGAWNAAYFSGLLLTVNIICVNLSANVVMAFKGIRPRKWYQRKKSKQSVRLSIIIWIALLIVLSLLIFFGSHEFAAN